MAIATGLLIAGAVVAAGAGVAAAQAKKNAANKAAKARQRALDSVQTTGPEAVNKLAQNADEERYTGQLALQKRVEPNAAAARESGLKELAGSVRTEQDTKAAAAADTAYAELAQDNPETAALRQQLLADAKAELDRGAELPPEFQAELVKAGLETSSRSGVGVSRMGAAGQTQRKLIGSAGLALKQQRTQNATAAVGAETQFQSARQQVLAGLSSQLMQIGNNRQARAANAVGVAQQLTPEFGLSGREMASLEMKRQDEENRKRLGTGEIQAGKALAQGQYVAELAGTAASAAQTGIGIYGQSAGGAGMAKAAAPAANYAQPVTTTPGYYKPTTFGYIQG